MSPKGVETGASESQGPSLEYWDTDAWHFCDVPAPGMALSEEYSGWYGVLAGRLGPW